MQMILWKNIHLNCRDKYEDMTDHRSFTQNFKAVVKLKPEKIQASTGLESRTFCDTSAVLYQLGYQASWELVTLWIRNIPVDDRQ